MNDTGARPGFGQSQQPLVSPPTYIDGDENDQDHEPKITTQSSGALSWDEPVEPRSKESPVFVGLNDKPDLEDGIAGDAKNDNSAISSPGAKTEMATPESDNSDDGDATPEDEVSENTSVVKKNPTPIASVETKNDWVDKAPQSEKKDSVLEPTIPPAPELLPDLKPYTHTIEQASVLMKEHHCKYHSERKVQRLCQDGKIDCYRLKTSRNGTAVTEWLVNGSSLSRHIKKYEKKNAADETTLPPVATPTETGDAKTKSGDANSSKSEANSTDAKIEVATPKQSRDAKNSKGIENSTDAISSLATLKQIGDAKLEEVDEVVESRVGDSTPTTDEPTAPGAERRFVQSREVATLIENAELLAKLQLKDEIITDLRADKDALKEQVEDHRANEKRLQQDLKEMAQNAINQTLTTLQNIALGGVLTPRDVNANNQSDQDQDNPQLGGKGNGV